MKIWTVCDKGHIHWGSKGGAGILFRHEPRQGEAVYLLQQRCSQVEFGETWGIPGGAIQEGESPEAAARREAEEEIGPLPPFQETGVESRDCGGGWRFHVVYADVDCPFPAYSVRETDATGWFTRDEMSSLTLHPGLRKSLDEIGFWSS
jgi:8-oxo-dGTP diphosphatase